MSERQRANQRQSAGLFGAAEGGPRKSPAEGGPRKSKEQVQERSRRATTRNGLGVVVREFRTSMAVLPAFGAALLGRPATTTR